MPLGASSMSAQASGPASLADHLSIWRATKARKRVKN
jgi:hypothetical protein